MIILLFVFMKVLYFGTFDSNAGGPAMSTYFTLKGLRDRGVDAALLQFPLSEGGRLRCTEVPVHYPAAPIVPKICYSPKLKKNMRPLGEYDIYHILGVAVFLQQYLEDGRRVA